MKATNIVIDKINAPCNCSYEQNTYGAKKITLISDKCKKHRHLRQKNNKYKDWLTRFN